MLPEFGAAKLRLSRVSNFGGYEDPKHPKKTKRLAI